MNLQLKSVVREPVEISQINEIMSQLTCDFEILSEFIDDDEVVPNPAQTLHDVLLRNVKELDRQSFKKSAEFLKIMFAIPEIGELMRDDQTFAT